MLKSMSVKEWIILAVSVKKSQRNWLSFEPLRLYPENVALCKSFSCWQDMHNRTPGTALRRASGIGSPHDSHSSRLSPWGSSPRARATASSMVLLICSFTASSFAQPDAITFRVPEVKCSAVRRKNRIARSFQTMSRTNVIQISDQTSEAGNSRWYIYPVALYGYLTPLLKGECHVRPEIGVTPAQPPSTPL